MTRTRRIYNRLNLKKCHRYRWDTEESIEEISEQKGKEAAKEALKTMVTNPLRNSTHNYGLIYTPYRCVCMGRCAHCRDQTKNQRLIRKRRFQAFRKQLKDEGI